MTRTLKRMPTPAGIGAGQTASVALPLGLTYERLNIRMKVEVDPNVGTIDVPAADFGDFLDDIRIMVDGDSRIEIDAGLLVKLNNYYGQIGVAGVLPVFLSRPWMRTIGGEDQSGYGTAGGISTLTLEMDIKPGITIRSLEVYAVQSPGKPFGAHLRIQRFVRSQGVTGTAEISDIPRGAYAMLAMHVDTAAIEAVEVEADGREIHRSDEALRDAHYSVIGRVPQANMTHVDFLTENRLSEALPMALSDFRIKANFTSPGNFNIIAESLQGSVG